MEIKTLKQVIQPNNYFIYSYLKTYLSTDILNFIDDLSTDSANAIDDEYIFNNSGDKYISPLAEHYLQNDILDLSKLMKLIVARFKNKWNKLYELTKLEYNPIENYDRYEDLKTNSKIEETGNGDGETNVFGFNSKLGKKANTSNTNSSRVIEGTKENNFQENHIHGNIGVTTTSQMMNGEIALWQWEFIKSTYKDIDELLCLEVF